MKPNPRNILKLSDKRYDAEKSRTRIADSMLSTPCSSAVIRFLRKRGWPSFTDTSICSGCKSCEIASASSGTCSRPRISNGRGTATTIPAIFLQRTGGTSSSSSASQRSMKRTEQPLPRWTTCFMNRNKGNGSSWPTTASIARSHPVMKPALPAPSFAMNSEASITRPISAWAVVCVWLPAPSASLK